MNRLFHLRHINIKVRCNLHVRIHTGLDHYILDTIDHGILNAVFDVQTVGNNRGIIILVCSRKQDFGCLLIQNGNLVCRIISKGGCHKARHRIRLIRIHRTIQGKRNAGRTFLHPRNQCTVIVRNIQCDLCGINQVIRSKHILQFIFHIAFGKLLFICLRGRKASVDIILDVRI